LRTLTLIFKKSVTFATREKYIKNVRRKDKEITNINDKLSIIKKCKVCRIGLSENNKPYIVPLNYGYDFENNTLTLFFHSANEGRKMDIIKNNNNACFEVDCDTKLIEAEKVCKYSYLYKSIVGFGNIILIEDINDKTDALNKIVKHQTERETNYTFSFEEIKNITIYKMVVEEFTGKQKIIDK
jgi:nitroimidazol reductase NimA-like FMN-containing flavoprotein (pyridoxamine 5'-phosphate oxidase superfamily)